MGDTWPWVPPKYTSWQAVYDYFRNQGFNASGAATFASIAEAEASFDLTVVNDTPATGDYSVGTFQINYYNGLAAERISLFGTPRHLAGTGLAGQAAAAHYLWSARGGWGDWSTYNDGSYLAYMRGNVPAGGGAVGGTVGPVLTEISPPTEDYSATVKKSAGHIRNTGNNFLAVSHALHHIKDTNIRG